MMKILPLTLLALLALGAGVLIHGGSAKATSAGHGLALDGDQPQTMEQFLTGVTKDVESGKDVPSVLLTPKAITKETVKDVVADGFVTKEELCTGSFAALCTENGIS